MVSKTIADRVLAAVNTGKEVKFYTNDVLSQGTEYEFTPEGLSSYILDSGEVVTEVVTQVELVSGGGTITIPAGSTLDEALQIVLDAVDPTP